MALAVYPIGAMTDVARRQNPPRGIAWVLRRPPCRTCVIRSPGFKSTSASLCLAGMFWVRDTNRNLGMAVVHGCSGRERSERDENVIAGIDL